MKRLSIILLVTLLPLLSWAQEKEGELKVEGRAILYTTPELIRVSIPLQVKDTLYERCTSQLVERYNQIQKAFVNIGIPKKELQTQQMRVSENYKWHKGIREKEGFVGRMTLTVEQQYSPILLGQILEVLKKEKNDSGYSLSFALSQRQKDLLLEKVINRAVMDAKRKAGIIANANGVSLLAIKEINFDFKPYPSRSAFLVVEDEIEYDKEEETTNGSPKINLKPQRLKVGKSISIIWRIKEN